MRGVGCNPLWTSHAEFTAVTGSVISQRSKEKPSSQPSPQEPGGATVSAMGNDFYDNSSNKRTMDKPKLFTLKKTEFGVKRRLNVQTHMRV